MRHRLCLTPLHNRNRDTALTGKLIALVLMALLSACTDPGLQQLDRQLSDTRNRPKGNIEDLPQPEPPQSISYTGSHLRSPFQLHDNQSSDTGTPLSLTMPDTTRRKTELEQYPLNELSLVGTLRLQQARHYTALIDDGRGEVHRVKPGDYLGQDFGRVAGITEDSLLLEETVQDELGGWIKRTRKLTLMAETDD